MVLYDPLCCPSSVWPLNSLRLYPKGHHHACFADIRRAYNVVQHEQFLVRLTGLYNQAQGCKLLPIWSFYASATFLRWLALLEMNFCCPCGSGMDVHHALIDRRLDLFSGSA